MDSARPPGPASAGAAELAYFRGVDDLVLAAGVADARFDPEILEAAARSAAAAWAAAASGTTRPGAPAPLVDAGLLHPGGPGARTRLVVREPEISRIQVAHLAAGVEPPFVALVTDIRGRRCIEDSDTGDPVSGRPDQLTWFYEFWFLVRDGPAARPWRLARHRDPHDPDFLVSRETAGQYRERTGVTAPPPPAGPPHRYEITCGFFEHDVHTGGSASVVARLMQAPSADEAVSLILPAVIADLTRSSGVSDWRPDLTRMSVRELLG